MDEIKRRGGRRNEYLRQLSDLSNAWLRGTDDEFRSAIPALIDLPFCAYVLWHDRKPGDPWPAQMPWDASEPWSEMAMMQELDAMPLAMACDMIMLDELLKGNKRPLAQWLAAGWVPGAPVLLHLAGHLSKEDAYTNRFGDKLGVKLGKRYGTSIEKLLRDQKIADNVRQLLNNGDGYESAIEATSKDFHISTGTVRNAYDNRYAKK